MSPKIPIEKQVGSDGRVGFNKDYAPTLNGGKYSLFPLIYRRAIPLPDDLKMQAWGISNFENMNTGDWIVDVMDILNRADSDVAAADLASVLFEVDIYEHKKEWRFMIPKIMRSMNWLPNPGELILIKHDPSGTSFWSRDAYRNLITSLVNT